MTASVPRPGLGDTSEDQCYQGVCGGWQAFTTVIQTESQREAWLAADEELTACDPAVNGGRASACGCEIVTCSLIDDDRAALEKCLTPLRADPSTNGCDCPPGNCDCHECAAVSDQGSFPMYLALENDHGHGLDKVDAAVHSYMAWRNKNVRWSKWRPGSVAGDFSRGR